MDRQQLILIGFSVLSSLAAFMAVYFDDFRKVSLSLWICGLSVGGMYVGAGAEFLGIVQWILSTLVAIAFSFYSVFFGIQKSNLPNRQFLLPLIMGALFVTTFYLGMRDSVGVTFPSHKFLGLGEFGKVLVAEYLFALEILCLILFLVIVGAGVVSRPESKSK